LPKIGDHKEHVSSVFHFNAKKVLSDALSYARIQAVDQYLKGTGQPLDKKCGASFFYLTEEQYREVMYLITIYPQLLILQFSIQTMEYICASPSAMDGKIIYQVMLLCACIGQAVNSSKCQISEGRTEVMSLNTPTTPMDISAKQ
jgi:hypothetical protein